MSNPPQQDLASVNSRALALRAAGRLPEAIRLLEDVAHGAPADLHLNLGFMLRELGEMQKSLRAYSSAAELAPRNADAHFALGSVLFAMARNDEAEAAFRNALHIDPDHVRANLAMYDLLHVRRDLAGAVTYQMRALRRQRVFSHIAPREARRVLVLCAPGDLQANVPVDFLFDNQTTTYHKFYMLEGEGPALPPHDAVFNAIAESPASEAPLRLAEAFLHLQDKPWINLPARLPATNRAQIAAIAQSLPACSAASVRRLSRETLLRPGGAPDSSFLIRPPGSQAGIGLARIDEREQLLAYLAENGELDFYVSPFVDYRNADGYYRKYRVFLVDGEPYPCHLAVSQNWMIHYYNAPMRENQWMRDEEARFLEDIANAFSVEHLEALRSLARKVGLEYFGVDCTVGPDGRLFIFEADPAMIVHATDPVDIYPYKHAYVPRIFRAVEKMLDTRIRKNSSRA